MPEKYLEKPLITFEELPKRFLKSSRLLEDIGKTFVELVKKPFAELFKSFRFYELFQKLSNFDLMSFLIYPL